MTEREQFEAWATEEGWCNFKRINEGYAVDHLDDVWQCWQASRRAALEECWNICNVYADRLKGSKETASGHVALILTADEIRKLGRESTSP